MTQKIFMIAKPKHFNPKSKQVFLQERALETRFVFEDNLFNKCFAEIGKLEPKIPSSEQAIPPDR